MTTLTYSRITKTGKLVEFTYSECDKELIDNYKWYFSAKGYIVTNYRQDGKKDTIKNLHRLLMNEPDGMVVDHIDGNTLNNTRDNLRICTQRENAKNQGVRKNNTSGYKGVSFKKHNQKWRARIHVNDRDKFLGDFETIEEAIEARRKAELEYYGEYARI